jgi:hypothetical protein
LARICDRMSAHSRRTDVKTRQPWFCPCAEWW